MARDTTYPEVSPKCSGAIKFNPTRASSIGAVLCTLVQIQTPPSSDMRFDFQYMRYNNYDFRHNPVTEKQPNGMFRNVFKAYHCVP